MIARLLIAIALLAALVALPGCEDETRAEAPPLGRDAVPADVTGLWTTDPADYENAAHNQVLAMIRNGQIDATEDDLPRLVPQVVEILRQRPNTYQFNQDATFTASSHNMTVTGTWSLEGDSLVIVADEGSTTRRFRVSDRRLESIASTEGGKPVALIPG